MNRIAFFLFSISAFVSLAAMGQSVSVQNGKAVYDQWCRLDVMVVGASLIHPGKLQPGDVAPVDLVKTGVSTAVQRARVGKPVLWLRFAIEYAAKRYRF